MPVIPLDLPAYQRKENWGAAETFYQLVRACAGGVRTAREGRPALCNLLGPTSLGFRNRDDVVEIRRLIESLGVSVNVVAPLGASAADLACLGEADFNVVLYPEIADLAARWLEKKFAQPAVRVVPIGVGATREFVAAVCAAAAIEAPPTMTGGNLPWFSRSVDATYLTGKRVFVFGDATHAISAARVAADELGFAVVGLGTYSREFARDVREAAARYGIEALICDDYLEVEECIAALEPDLVLGTQMERHIAKKLGVPCAVISAPVHVQDFPARYSPQMGFEGANVLFDTWVHPLMMGLEEHLLSMFREDTEFGEGAAPSHLGHAATEPEPVAEAAGVAWLADAERELKRVPVFVRGKARRNTERFARDRGIVTISVQTLYEAKAHHAR